MNASDVEEVVFSSSKFRSLVTRIAMDSVVSDFETIRPTYVAPAIDWNFGLLCASALTSAESETAQDAVLRVAQGCLNSQADGAVRDAAAMLLERLGNRPAVGLATSRGLIGSNAIASLPVALQMDVIRRRLEFSIPAEGQSPIQVNRFQRQFWDEVTQARWISVSAPTSAGKSYIVRRWLERATTSRETFCGVYLVPTRALIEEVSRDLRNEFGRAVPVHTMPWDPEIGASSKELHVLTQERFHLLQQRLVGFKPDIVFIDEAQKIGDEQRGVLLQQVLAEVVRRRVDTQVIFASPLSENPEILLEGAPSDAVTASFESQTVTVNQNLLWVNQVPRRPKEWEICLVVEGDEQEVGLLELADRPSPDSRRLSAVAVALGGRKPGNIVYENGAAAAEKTARQIFEALGPDTDLTSDSEIAELMELARSAVHPEYVLAEVVARGVAFHYGNMPQLLRSEIERLFRTEKLRYLVCTSTLLEGVNLPCRNLFTRGPRKGNGRPMSSPDFWNLAGRAGRWGKEFQGNIVCIDTTKSSRWPTPPTRRTRHTLVRASDRATSDIDAFLDFITSGTQLEECRSNPVLESVFSLLSARFAQTRSLAEIPGLDLTEEQFGQVTVAVATALQGVEIPPSLMARHAGISPISMQRLLKDFRKEIDQASLLVAPPASRDAASTYARALSRIARFLGGNFGDSRRQFALAILITNWMRGQPLARLISERIGRETQAAKSIDVSGTIRSVMQDVEQIARFQAPKYLACYLDVLRLHLEELGVDVSDDNFPDVSMFLELGVSRKSEVSLMVLGLSRTSTVALSDFMPDEELSPQSALLWLSELDMSTLDIPSVVRREVAELLAIEPTADEI